MMRTRIERLLVCAGAWSMLAALTISPAGAVTIPDFSGLWGRNAFNFEPLPAGPKPLTNLERLPDGTANRTVMVGDYTNPILKPGAAKTVEQLGKEARLGKPHDDPSNQCQAYPPPFAFSMQLGFQMLQAEDHITILYNQDDQVRRVRLNSAHPRPLAPTPMGDSVGHYERDTLVIDTVGVALGRKYLPMIDRYGTPRSSALHVVERYRLIDGKAAKESAERQMQEDGPRFGAAVLVDATYKGPGLQLTFTVEDPNVFTTPWSAAVTYRRTTGPWLEQVCAEGLQDYYAGHAPFLPVADRPDF
jgi:hypothetical protein